MRNEHRLNFICISAVVLAAMGCDKPPPPDPAKTETIKSTMPIASSSASAAAAPPVKFPPGRTAWPKANEWATAPAVNITGAEALGCKAWMVREYLKITCTEGEKNKKPIGVKADFGVEVRTLSLRDQITAIFPVFEGSHNWVNFLWSRKEARVMVDWFPGETRPDPLGKFDLLMDRHGFEPDTGLDRRICECSQNVGKSCTEYIGVADEGCRAHYNDCNKLLRCAIGEEPKQCYEPGYQSMGPDATCHMSCDAFDACPVGARCEVNASPKYCIQDNSLIHAKLSQRRDPKLPDDAIHLPEVNEPTEKFPRKMNEDGKELVFHGHMEHCSFQALDGWVEISCYGFPRFLPIKGPTAEIKTDDRFYGRLGVRYGDAEVLIAIGSVGYRFTITQDSSKKPIARMTTFTHGINGGFFFAPHKVTPPWDALK